MVTRTFLSKCNTISNASKENFGLNPICSLNYGGHISRVLVYFDEKELKKLVDDKTYKNREKLSHHLKMTNCGSIDPKKFFEKDEAAKYLGQKHRASSFDVIAFKIPKIWDAGTGFDDSTDTWFLGYKSSTKDGSTWENSMTGVPWKEPVNGEHTFSARIDVPFTNEESVLAGEFAIDKKKLTYTVNFKEYSAQTKECSSNIVSGIYSSDFLWKEYNRWTRDDDGNIVIPKDCIVIGRQHFEYGNENLDIDITEFVNSVLFDKEKNYGLCLAFSPKLEETELSENYYVNFFTNNTNTFFAPYVETRYDAKINDDRYKFYVGKKNRLYFYAMVGGKPVELDETPTCEINAENAEISDVFSESKGIYYIETKLPKNEKERALFTDTWGNLKLDGEDIDDVEMEFETIPSKKYFNFGGEIEDNINLNPVIYGINDDQKLNQGELRELTVVFKVPYESSEYELVDEGYYRIYVKDGSREIDVIDWDGINTIGRKNMFTIKTSELLPQDYYIDIKAVIGRQTLVFKNQLHFKIISNVTELKK